MAHAFALFPNAASSYVSGRKDDADPQVKFPRTSFFSGFLRPSRAEVDIFSLETTGAIPRDLRGTFFRVQPDPRFPPVFEEDTWFSGDGAVTAFRFADGHVDMRHRYVHTDRFRAETAARKALFGRYRNPYTDHEMVRGVIRTVSNTNVLFWRGVLLAIKEDGPPFALDPATLETIGRYDFDGQVTAPCFTAHPKVDPETGEMVAFAYEAGGDGHDGSCDVAVWTFDGETGKKTHEAWYKAPFCGMIHDAALTKNYLILPLTPLKCDFERLKKGGNHWAWDPNEDQWYGIVPRRGGDIVWLRADNGFHGHIAGAYETERGTIICDLTIADGNVFFWWPPDTPNSNGDTPSNKPPARPSKLLSDTFRWEFDPRLPTNSRVSPLRTYGTNGEFSRIDDRFTTKPYRHFWQLQMDGSRPYDFAKCGPPAGGLFNVLGHYDWETGVKDEYFPGPTCTFQEPVFVPKNENAAEGEGYIMTLLNHLDVLRNDILVFDALDIAKGPIAAVHLPLKLRLGLHGNFVEEREMEDWRQRRREGGDIGPAKAASEPLPWQIAAGEKKDEAGTNGKHTNGNGVQEREGEREGDLTGS